jgi:small subunit ribosomal protein S14
MTWNLDDDEIVFAIASAVHQEQSPQMAQFRAKKLDIGCYVNKLIIRDHTKRKVFAEHETDRYVLLIIDGIPFIGANGFNVRQTLRYIAQNTSLPARMRAQAQLDLTQMHPYTRLTQIKNRCMFGGKGRGVFRDFRMSRVR